MAHIWPTLRRIKSDLMIVCACGNRQTWPRAVAIERLGGHTLPHEIRGKIRCDWCGARGRHGGIDIDARM
jgi:hypothetical protein